MAEITYLLGAGINRCVQGPDGLVPPLARDFFQLALRHRRVAAHHASGQLDPLLEFIQTYWHLSPKDLNSAEFDIEECFTFLELQRREAAASEDQKVLEHTSRLEWDMTSLLLDVMSECEYWYHFSEPFKQFAGRLLIERAAILTFNYDTLLESALESASPARKDILAFLDTQACRDAGNDEIRDDEISFSFHEWNPYLAYNIPFDEVALRLPGDIRMVDGERYFRLAGANNTVSPFLKLHGSLGWFYRTGYRIDNVPLKGDEASKVGNSVLRVDNQRFGVPQIEGWERLLPLLITPVLNKPYDQHSVFQRIWTKAEDELRGCKRLVIGGYSFPPTDFHVRRLLRLAYSGEGPRELWIINPDTRVVQIAKELCNYRKPVMVCSDIGEFLNAV